MPLALYALTAGAFGIGITEFVIMGLLLDIGRDLGVSTSVAGLLVSGYALGVVVGAPLLTLVTARQARKRTLLGLMVIFVIGNLACALAQGMFSLLAARVFTALTHGTFFGVGAVVAAELVAPNRRASAIALMFTGLTLANVLGVPFGSWLGHAVGWRGTFIAVALVGLCAFVALARWLPSTPAPRDASGHWAAFDVLRRTPVLFGLGTTVLAYTGVFTVFTYIATLLTLRAGFGETQIAPILLVFGVGLVIGNLLGGRFADHAPLAAIFVSLSALVLVLAGFDIMLAAPLSSVLAVGLLGAAAFSTVAPLQAWVMVRSAGAGESLASSFNIAAFNLGAALGALLGGAVIRLPDGLDLLPWCAAAVSALSLPSMLLAHRSDRRRFEVCSASPSC